MVALIISNSRGTIYEVWVGESSAVLIDKAIEWLHDEEHCYDGDQEAREDLQRDGYFSHYPKQGKETIFQIAEAAEVK